MQIHIGKLAGLTSAVVLALAVTHTAAPAAGPQKPGIVRLGQIGDGAVQQAGRAVQHAGGAVQPGGAIQPGRAIQPGGACLPGGGPGDICVPGPTPGGCCGDAAACREKKGCCLSGCRLFGCCSSDDECPGRCGDAPACREKKGCCLTRCCLFGCSSDDECPEYEDECENGGGCGCKACRLLGWRGNGDGLYDGYGYAPYSSAAEMRLAHLRCRFGYFIPTGECGQGLPFAGHYGLAYPLNPDYFDPRDGRIYAAQGYGTPIGVPLAPNVDFTYNYGWGVPSSRLTPVSRHVPGTRPVTWPIPPGQRY